MKSFFLCFLSFLATNIMFAQTGNTIQEAIPVDGINVALNLVDYNSATASNQLPACLSQNEDVFYRHTPSNGDNVLRIAMTTAGISLLSTIEYQILKAPNGNLNNLQVLDCNSYSVNLLIGGSFEFISSSSISQNDDYYLRVFKPNSGVNLTSVVNATTIAMRSTNTLSATSFNEDENKVRIYMSNNILKIYNNKQFKSYEIYNINGQKIKANNLFGESSEVEMSYQGSGIYILILENDKSRQRIKFVKT